jgi:hypothetical protein
MKYLLMSQSTHIDSESYILAMAGLYSTLGISLDRPCVNGGISYLGVLSALKCQ